MPKRRALLIGVWEYTKDPEHFPALRGPKYDLDTLHTALTDAETGLFAGTDVAVLRNPSKAEAETAIDTFFGDALRDDVLLFYYSGHGRLTLDDKFYMCATDTVEKRHNTSAIAAGTLRACLDSSQAETLVVVLDCCHSGAFRDGEIKELHGRGTFFLASTRERQLAADGDGGGPSPFTREVANALTSLQSDLDHDGLITFDDVYREVDAALRPLKQFPQRSVGEGHVVMAGHAANKADVPKSATPPASNRDGEPPDVTAITTPASIQTPLPKTGPASVRPVDPPKTWWSRFTRRHAAIAAGSVALLVGAGLTATLGFFRTPPAPPPEHWALASDAPAVCRLPLLASFDLPELASPDGYAQKVGKPVTLNASGAEICVHERRTWASSNCWYQVAVSDDLAVVEMYNGGSEKTRCSLDSADEIFAEPAPVRTATIESLMYQVGLVSARCAARREPCGRGTPCDADRVKAYDALAERGRTLIKNAIAWRKWELEQLSVGANFEGKDDGKTIARSSLDTMEDKLRQVEIIVAQKPYEESIPLDVTQKERTQSEKMNRGGFCVPCLTSDRSRSDACN